MRCTSAPEFVESERGAAYGYMKRGGCGVLWTVVLLMVEISRYV